MVNNQCSPVYKLLYGVPQGSVLGPVLYTMYTQPLGTVIEKQSMKYHMYADDAQIYMSAPTVDVPSLVHKFELCVSDVKNWMIENKLKMNEDKTEILVCNTNRTQQSGDIDYMCIENERIPFSDKAKNLGIYFDPKLSMQTHVNHLCRSMFLELRRIKQMSAFLMRLQLRP